MAGSSRVMGAGSPPTRQRWSRGLEPGQRWSASRKRDVVLRLLHGEPLDAVSREVGVCERFIPLRAGSCPVGVLPGTSARLW